MRGNQVEIEFFQQVVATVAASCANDRGNFLVGEHFFEFAQTAVQRPGKIKIAFEDVIREDRLIAHLAQTTTSSHETFAVETTRGRDNADFVAGAKSWRLNELHVKSLSASRRFSKPCVSQLHILPAKLSGTLCEEFAS